MEQATVRLVDVEPMYDTGLSIYGYMARGHVTAAEMQAGIEWYGDDEFKVEGKRLRHCYMRIVPAPPGNEFDFTVYFLEVDGPGRGAFVATVCEYPPIGASDSPKPETVVQ